MEKNILLFLVLAVGFVAVVAGALAVNYIVNANADAVTGAQTAQDDTLNAALLAQSQMEQKIADLQKELQKQDSAYEQKVKDIQEEALKQIEEAQLQAQTSTTAETTTEETCDQKIKRLQKGVDGAGDDVYDLQNDLDDALQNEADALAEVNRLTSLITNTTDSTQLSILRDQVREAQREYRDEGNNYDSAKQDLRDAENAESDLKRELRTTKTDCRNA